MRKFLFFSLPPDKRQNNGSVRSLLVPSKYFPFHRFSFIAPLGAMQTDILAYRKANHQKLSTQN
jgi:hypothetical protein